MNARQAELERARVDFERRRNLARTGAVSEEELTSARAGFEAARAQLAGARQHLEAQLALTRGTSVAEHPETVAARAATVLSRGQGKIVASAMVLGQATHLAKVAHRSSVFLIDDLGAELDTDHGRRLLLALHRMGCQVLATSTQSPDATELGSKVPVCGFHVKHGAVVRMGADHPRASR